jgi:hypothetical protein
MQTLVGSGRCSMLPGALSSVLCVPIVPFLFIKGKGVPNLVAFPHFPPSLLTAIRQRTHRCLKFTVKRLVDAQACVNHRPSVLCY